MQFKVNGMNQFTNVSRTGIMTVSGAMDHPSGGATISVVGTGLPTTTAVIRLWGTSQRSTNGVLGLTCAQCRGSNPLHGKTTAH
jgi:hypothetical protein